MTSIGIHTAGSQDMDSSFSSAKSPPSQRNGSKSDDGPSPFTSRVPKQKSIPSASQIPTAPPKASASSQMASARYLKQFRALMEHQREVFDEERALWHTERSELHDKITQLEGTIQRYQAISSSQVSSPIDRFDSGQNGGFWGLLSSNGSRHTSASTTGDEVWRGSKPDVKPTRTFSESSNQSIKPDSRLPSIAEDIKHETGSPPPHNAPQASIPHKPSISGALISKNLDGITFKTNSLSPSLVRKVMPPGSASPRQSPSPSRISPGTIELAPPSISPPKDLYTKDAGHTPLARCTNFNIDDSSGDHSSDSGTPTRGKQERPPLEPHATMVKTPSERQNSYFPPGEESKEGEDDALDADADADPELNGPLSLKNEANGDERFLSELDSKLLQAANEEAPSPSESSAGDENKENRTEREDERFEEPEREPKLRIKRSMNFGSQLGDRHCGRGI